MFINYCLDYGSMGCQVSNGGMKISHVLLKMILFNEDILFRKIQIIFDIEI